MGLRPGSCGPWNWAPVRAEFYQKTQGAAEETGWSSRHSPVPFDALGCKRQSRTEGSVSRLWVVGYLTGVVLSVSDDTDRCVCSWLVK